MIYNTRVHRILFLDIETVSQAKDYLGLSSSMKGHWIKKAKFFKRDIDNLTDEELNDFLIESYAQKAAIYAEFSRIVCISLGVVKKVKGINTLRVKSFYGQDESTLLQDFVALLEKHYANINNSYFCGHNIREFDIPFICRRLIVNRIPLPKILQISGKKPWEVKYLIDTLELWKFGDYKHFISLDLMANLLNIPSPKQGIDGSKVGYVFWQEGRLNDIVHYCERDVKTVAQIFLTLNDQPLINDEDIFYATDEEE